MSRVITIGREFGSGGRELGKRLADIFDIAYYDNEIISEIAKKTELAEEYIHQVVENSPAPFFPITIGRTFYTAASPQMEMSTSIYAEQSNIITEMAQKSPCVIVGRCADYILRDMKPCRIFVYADMESKLARCRLKAGEHEHMSDKELRRHILGIDKGRANYYRFFTGKKWGDWLNYDLCINTTGFNIKDISESVAGMIKAMK